VCSIPFLFLYTYIYVIVYYNGVTAHHDGGEGLRPGNGPERRGTQVCLIFYLFSFYYDDATEYHDGRIEAENDKG
jgi:hypothetical protein